MNHVIDLCPSHAVGILEILYGNTEPGEQEDNQNDPEPPGPFFWQQGSCQKARRIEQNNIHEVASQNLRVTAVLNLAVGVEGNQGNCIMRGS